MITAVRKCGRTLFNGSVLKAVDSITKSFLSGFLNESSYATELLFCIVSRPNSITANSGSKDASRNYSGKVSNTIFVDIV